MFRHLKLLNYFKEMNLSPEETLTLIRRLETDSCCAEDYEVLMRIVRAHTDLSADFLEASPGAQPAGRQRQGVKRTRRHRREANRVLTRLAECGISFPHTLSRVNPI